jgi:hypothetical protein
MHKLLYQTQNTTTFLIFSPKYGEKECLIDSENWDKIKHSHLSIIEHSNLFYVRCNKILLHRIFLNITNSKIFIDHKNHNGLDNRMNNLRISTNAQNQWNQRLRKDNTSGFKGVSFFQGKWMSLIRFNNKKIFLGLFNDKIEAAIAYNNKAKELFGNFAYTNKI